MIGAMPPETLCKWLAASALPWTVMTVLGCRTLTAGRASSTLWLPLAVRAEATATPSQTPLPSPTPTATYTPRPTPTATLPPAAPGEVHHGSATYYHATGGGACSFDPTPDDLMVAALNDYYYADAALCGAYVEVAGPKGTVLVRVVDLCPGCLAVGLDLDLSQQAFAAIADLAKGRIAVTWRVVSPELDGPIVYRFADGASRWWTGVQVRNHRNPMAMLEYRDGSGTWAKVPRTAWNYFVRSSPGMGPGPYELRVTDCYGNQLIDAGVPLTPGGAVQGSALFPPAPGQ